MIIQTLENITKTEGFSEMVYEMVCIDFYIFLEISISSFISSKFDHIPKRASILYLHT